MDKKSGKHHPFDMAAGTISCMPWLVRVTFASLAVVIYLGQSLTAAHVMPRPSAGERSIHQKAPPTHTVHDRKNQWFFAKAIAQSIWELAMYAEGLTLNSSSDRVETLQEIYAVLIDIEGELALKRRDLADQYGITDALMSHVAHVLTTEQKHAFDTYMQEVITWHQKANTIVEQDALIKSYYGHLLALNGMTAFAEQFQEFLRTKPPQLNPKVNF